MELSVEELRKRLRNLMPRFEERYGVSKLWLFGSRVRGAQHPSSDVDVLVEFGKRGISLFDFAGLTLEMEDALGVKVDLVERGALRRELRNQVFSEAVAV